MLLTAAEWQNLLWWLMLATAVIAAALAIAATILDRRKPEWSTRQQRFLMHLASYGFLTGSILAFIALGLLRPA
jgi:hypothetical protein